MARLLKNAGKTSLRSAVAGTLALHTLVHKGLSDGCLLAQAAGISQAAVTLPRKIKALLALQDKSITSPATTVCRS